jgi:hypothetical protein
MHRSVQQPRKRRALSKRTAAIISIIGVLAVSAIGVAVARYLGRDGGSHTNATNLAGKSTSDRNAQAVGSRSRSAPAPDPTHAGSGAPKPRHRPAPRRTPHHASPTPTSATCSHPQFQTSDPAGGWTDGNCYVSNNMWNASGYSVSQTLYACSYANWYVVANMNNDNGDGAVKTYPNAQETFGSNPEISSFHSVSSTFAEKSPHVGIYEDAYDIWINGLATSGSTEVMIWTENFHQAPSGSVVATVSFGGRSYKVWKSGSYIAFVADANFTSGTVNLLRFFKFIINKHWIAGNSALSQIDYGAEIVSTNSAPATFTFTNFSVHTS